MNANLELMVPRELPAGMQQEIESPGDEESNWENTPQSILQSTLGSLNDERISEAIAQFDWSDYYAPESWRRIGLA